MVFEDLEIDCVGKCFDAGDVILFKWCSSGKENKNYLNRQVPCNAVESTFEVICPKYLQCLCTFLSTGLHFLDFVRMVMVWWSSASRVRLSSPRRLLAWSITISSTSPFHQSLSLVHLAMC